MLTGGSSNLEQIMTTKPPPPLGGTFDVLYLVHSLKLPQNENSTLQTEGKFYFPKNGLRLDADQVR